MMENINQNKVSSLSINNNQKKKELNKKLFRSAGIQLYIQFKHVLLAIVFFSPPNRSLKK